jgi:L-2-hydroxyglutarate oxidase LhgO
MKQTANAEQQQQQQQQPAIVPVRGTWYKLTEAASRRFTRNVYPVADARYPFLGVHVTPRVTGEVLIGPNAVLAFSRQGYALRDINVADVAGMLGHAGTRRLLARHWRFGLTALLREAVCPVQSTVAALQRFAPGITPHDLRRDDTLSGVRAQAVSHDGSLVEDFIFEADDDARGRFLHVRNAPSPGATSCLAIAQVIADKAQQLFFARLDKVR